MIKVFFDYGSATELVATFETEDVYIKCLPILKEIAKECRGEIVEYE
jgi:hypothetical protein